MITRNTDYSIQHLRGLSTDTKPTDVPNGSEFREMDTGKKFLYSAAGTEWIEQQGSGGGSGGGGELFIVTLTPTSDDMSGTMDKTAGELTGAYNAGKTIVAKLDSVSMYPISVTVLRDIAGVRWIACSDDVLHVISSTISSSISSTYTVTTYQLTPAGN